MPGDADALEPGWISAALDADKLLPEPDDFYNPRMSPKNGRVGAETDG
jgi:hypothetical protein